MRKFIIAIAALCAIALASAPAAQAQNAVQYPLAITASDVAAATEWTVPYRQDGALLTWQALGAGSAETVEVKHISAYSATAAYTNTIETAAARNTLHAYPTAYVPPQSVCTNTTLGVVITTSPIKPVFLQAGDKLTFKLSATNASSVVIIKTTLRD